MSKINTGQFLSIAFLATLVVGMGAGLAARNAAESDKALAQTQAPQIETSTTMYMSQR